MILVDFEKAFDAISWEYISKTLEIFNFGQKTISIIKSLQKDSKSKILQNGHLSESIILFWADKGFLYLLISLFWR